MRFSKSGTVKRWGILRLNVGYQHLGPLQDDAKYRPVIQSVHRVLKETGINIGDPIFSDICALRDDDDLRIEATLQKAAKNVDLLFIMLPKDNMPVYDRIKHLCDVRFGLATICSVGSKLMKPAGQDQYMRNLALKFNLKLGGDNQVVKSKIKFFEEDKTMVVGIDVTHPSPGSSQSAPSVAGMVANVDKGMGQWPATLAIQAQARQEMGKYLF